MNDFNMNPLIKDRKFFIRFRGSRSGKEFGFFDYLEIPLSNIEPYLIYDYNQWVLAYKRRKLKTTLFVPQDYPSKCAGIWFNQLKPGITNTHQHDKFDKPIISWIDIDLKTPEQINDFKRDLGDKYDFITELEKNNYVWLIGESQSGGIRIGFIVDYQGDSESPDIIYKLNQNIISKALTDEYGYNYKGDSTYADSCSNRISQPSFSLKWVKLNHNALSVINTTNKPEERIMVYDNFKTNANNDQLLKQLQFHPTNELKILLSHWTATLGGIIKESKHKDIWQILLKKNYNGKSLSAHLDTTENWIKYINNCKSLGYSRSLKDILNKIKEGKKWE